MPSRVSCLATEGRTTIGVTGATGLIGSQLVARLAQRPGTKVVALTRTIARAWQTDNVEWMHGDLASYRDASDFVRGLDVVIHLAHTNTPLTSNDDLPSDAAMNLGLTLTLIQAVRSSPGRCHVVFSSSGGAVYGPPNDARRALTEDDPCEPVNSYGIQKLMGEHYLRLAADEGWLTATVLRIGNAYGVALPRERGQGFLGVAMADHARQIPFASLVRSTTCVTTYI